MILCDTNVLFAAANIRDTNHRLCTDEMARLRLNNEQLLVSALVVAEMGYLLAKISARAEAEFLDSVAEGDFVCVAPTELDFRRIAQLVRQYADTGLGTTDASIVALAERLRIDTVATLDRRHFDRVRPRHVPTLTLLPAGYAARSSRSS